MYTPVGKLLLLIIADFALCVIAFRHMPLNSICPGCILPNCGNGPQARIAIYKRPIYPLTQAFSVFLGLLSSKRPIIINKVVVDFITYGNADGSTECAKTHTNTTRKKKC